MNHQLFIKWIFRFVFVLAIFYLGVAFKLIDIVDCDYSYSISGSHDLICSKNIRKILSIISALEFITLYLWYLYDKKSKK